MNLVERVKRILLSPRTEWEMIDAEQTTPTELYTRYIMPLAAIGPIARLIGFSVVGMPVPLLGMYREPIGSAITRGVVDYVLALAAPYILALIMETLAPTFNGQRSKIQALKLAAYSLTAVWLSGIFLLVPLLSDLSTVGGLYSVYLLYLGLPVLLKTPRDKSVAYVAVVIIAGFVLMLVIRAIGDMFSSVPRAGLMP